MNSFQRTIKYIAIGFAILLAVGIISAIVNVSLAITSALSGGFASHKTEALDFSGDFTGVSSLDVRNSVGKLVIREGAAVKVEAENVPEGFEARVTRDGTLRVSEDNRGLKFLWFHLNRMGSPNSRITIYLPKDFMAEDVKLDTGAGNVEIEGLRTKELSLSAGTGNINGNNITAGKVRVDGGVGNMEFENVSFSDSDFDGGVGNISVEGTILGKNKFSCGVGDVKLELTGDVNAYGIRVDAGVGTVRLNGEKLSDEYRNNTNAANSIDIDGGVGNVTIEIRQ